MFGIESLGFLKPSWLVVESTPLKNMTSSAWIIIPIWLGTIENSMWTKSPTRLDLPKIWDDSSQNMGWFFPKYGMILPKIWEKQCSKPPTSVLLDRNLCPRGGTSLSFFSPERNFTTWPGQQNSPGFPDNLTSRATRVLDIGLANGWWSLKWSLKKSANTPLFLGGWYQILRYFKLEFPDQFKDFKIF